MAVTNWTPLLGLALPTTGDLSGVWGTTVNDAITSLLDSAVAGTTTLSADADVTLSTTNGVANQSRNAVLLWTASGTVTRNITAPAQSKAYVVINATGSTQSVVVRGVGPTTGVTVIAGEKCLVAWNGSDFVKVSSTVSNMASVTGTLGVANGGTGQTSLTANALLVGNNTTAVQTISPGSAGYVLTSTGSVWQAAAPPAITATFNEYTSSGTWNKPAGTTFVMVECWGGGGGGASGARGASGNYVLAGAGGGGGAYTYRLFKASDLSSSVTVTVGAGGTGGAAITSNDTSGNRGSDGGTTSFGTYLDSYGGGGGENGVVSGTYTNAIYGGGGGGVLSAGAYEIPGYPTSSQQLSTSTQYYGQFGGGATTGGSGFGGGGGGRGTGAYGYSSYQGGAGGGGGGYIDNSLNYLAGGKGGSNTGLGNNGANGGAVNASGSAGSGRQGGGGGGAGNAANAGAGGAGGLASGGGGGGAALNGNNSGAGGVGGDGLVRVYSW